MKTLKIFESQGHGLLLGDYLTNEKIESISTDGIHADIDAVIGYINLTRNMVLSEDTILDDNVNEVFIDKMIVEATLGTVWYSWLEDTYLAERYSNNEGYVREALRYLQRKGHAIEVSRDYIIYTGFRDCDYTEITPSYYEDEFMEQIEKILSDFEQEV